ncbi:MAG TPA: hypothetical protein VFJ29_04170, partial [Candidatus Kapabacteria bacterium]|nr:hypothetical protein [Candidatus Kapabacteria bacterium]
MDIPHTISYQGILIDRSGQPVPDGIHRMTIRLYVSDSGNVGIYFTQTNVTTKSGIFNVILGAPYTDTLPSSLNLNQPLWLGVQLDNNAEMRPLTPVTGTMYALNVADNSISTEKIQDSAVTIGKILPEFVGSVSAGGSKLTTKG